MAQVTVTDNRQGPSQYPSRPIEGNVAAVEQNRESLFLILDTGYTVRISKRVLQKEIVLEKLRGDDVGEEQP